MSWYYTREPGAEGSILTDEGEAPGVLLSELLGAGRPPLKSALEIASALADILTIAEEDEGVHGDIKVGFVRVDAGGGVSLEGYGIARRTTRAPEGSPVGVRTDVYGLGVVLHSMMSDEPLGRLPKDPDDHDDAVVDRVLAMDFTEVRGRRWLEDVRRFLCQILAFEHEERPDALDAANVLATVADQCPGSGIEQWAPRAVRRAGGEAAPRRAAEREDLGGPADIRSPLPRGKTGQFKPAQRQAPSAKGESTQMWSRDRIAAMLQDEDDEWEEESLEAPRPISGGWNAEDLAPPEPIRQQRPPQQRPPPPPQQPRAPAPRQPAPRQPAQPPPAPPIAKGPVAQGPIAQGPIAQGPVAQGPMPPAGPPAPPEEKSSPLKFVVLGAGCFMFACLGLVGAGALGWVFYDQQESASVFEPQPMDEVKPSLADLEDIEPERFDSDEPEPDPADFNGAPKTSTKKTTSSTTKTTSAKSIAPKTSTKKSSSKTTSSGSTTKTTAKTTTSAPPVESAPVESAPVTLPTSAYEAKISLNATSKAELRCGDGQTQKFAGAVRLTFNGEVNCVITVGDRRGVVTVTGPGQYICTDTMGAIMCSTP